MRMSNALGKTWREIPAEADMVSHQLLIRGNFVRPLGAGIFTFMPLGYRVIRKLWHIMAQEMEAIGCQEMWMPNLHPAAVWQATGRWQSFGPVMMRVETEGGRQYAISPTHEEVVNALSLTEIESHRDLPQRLFHISKKFRNETRPRGGLIRLREFIMKDAYSLDAGEKELNLIYRAMLGAYKKIFARCQIPAIPIQADVGAMGGKSSHEFTVPHPQGEDMYISCTACTYAANVEAAAFVREGESPSTLSTRHKLATPDCKSIEAVATFVGVPTSQTLKAVFYWFTPAGEAESSGRLLFALVRGDLEISEVKLLNSIGDGTLRAADEAEIEAVGAVPGYASPVDLPVATDRADTQSIFVVGDLSLTAGGNFVTGANDEGYHYTGVNYPRDFTITQLADIAQADTGHLCPQCQAPIAAHRAIEVGHCFQLGTRYSAATEATFLDVHNQPQLIHMGSYGIGLDRLMAVIVEEHHDEYGIIWPDAVAPYPLHLMSVGKDAAVVDVAEKLYTDLQDAGYELFYDDRPLSAGVKFNDADLIGIPIRITVGKRNLAQNKIEVKRRAEKDRRLVDIDNIISYLAQC